MKTSESFPQGTTRTVSMDTKKDKDGLAKHHTVTFDFSGCSIEHVMGLALDAGKVKLQTRIRKHWRDYMKKTSLTIKVAELGSGKASGISPGAIKSYLEALSDEERVAHGLAPRTPVEAS